MLTWTEGPREFGCVYHKKAALSAITVSGQVDVFVRPQDAATRPIAITINLTTRRAGKKRLRGSLGVPEDAPSLRKRLPPRLVAVGVSEDRATAFVEDVIALVNKDASTIEAALEIARRKR